MKPFCIYSSSVRSTAGLRRSIALSVILGLLHPVVAQDTSTEAEEPVYELSPFVVSTERDRGYLATNSVSGTSLNMQIRDLPMPLEVINREMLDDMQATDLKESLRYSAGVFTQSFATTSTAVSGFQDSSPSSQGADVNDPFQNTISIRGYKVPNQQRMGFRVGGIVPKYGVVLGGNTDTITTERSEVVRGPQALLYGINVLSGIVNVIPKRPMADFASGASLSVGNYDFLRATFESTGPLIRKKLNYNVMMAHQEQGAKRMFREDERDTFAIQFDYIISPKVSLFVEYLNSQQTSRGIGRQFFVDDGIMTPAAGTPAGMTWTNEFGERITYGRDDARRPIENEFGYSWPEGPVVENPNRPAGFYDSAFSDLGPYYNVSGPDTYLKRKEENYLALLTLRPTRDLTFELGGYYTKVQDERFDVDMQVFTNSYGSAFSPSNATGPGGSFITRPAGVPGGPIYNTWMFNPEVLAAGVASDPIGYGLGEAFVFPRRNSTPAADGAFIIEFDDPQDKATATQNDYSRKFAYTTWSSIPTSSETMQLRGRVAYKYERDVFNIPAVHTFTGGYHFIQDEMKFVIDPFHSGNATDHAGRNGAAFYTQTVPARVTPAQLAGTEPFLEARDAVTIRNSVYDYSPIRYNGETLAFPGLKNFGGLGASRNDLDVLRSGWKEATLWYRGAYAIYQGQFWQDKLTVIGGVRRDAYQVREREQLMIVDRNRVSGIYTGTGSYPTIPILIGYGDQDYNGRNDPRLQHLPESLHQRVDNSFDLIRASRPNGTSEHLYDDYQEYTTRTFGLSWRVTDAFSLYYLYSEGVFPNTGQRDGNYKAIDAEQTRNNEIGAKMEFFDGRISGTISVFQIQRKNAVYNWNGAPAPGNWHGAENGPSQTSGPEVEDTFSPQAATGANSGYLGDKHVPVSYGIALAYVKKAFEEKGMLAEYEAQVPNSGMEADAFEHYGAINYVGHRTHGTPDWITNFLTVPYSKLSDPAEADNPMKLAFDMAMRREPIEVDGQSVPFNGVPIMYNTNQQTNTALNNPSEGRGANVLFEEEGIGIDGQIIFSPLTNYQIIFTFSHQQREVSGRGFTLLDAVDENGTQWGTEYDYWLYILGPENFEDPTRPSTYNGASVRGLDLSFVPQTSFRLLNKYSFREGVLEGLEIGGGAEYNGPVSTAVPIGGADLAENRFLTPDVPERVTFNLFSSYTREMWGIRWTLRLNVNNLLNDHTETLISEYDNGYGKIEKRRTEILYEPRTWRLSLSARF